MACQTLWAPACGVHPEGGRHTQPAAAVEAKIIDQSDSWRRSAAQERQDFGQQYLGDFLGNVVSARHGVPRDVAGDLAPFIQR
jgi:hypothetical protein